MITKENSETATRFEHISLKNADGTPARCKRTGKTRTWKTCPARFKIPVKHGLRGYFYIQNFDDKFVMFEKGQHNNAAEWIVTG